MQALPNGRVRRPDSERRDRKFDVPQAGHEVPQVAPAPPIRHSFPHALRQPLTNSYLHPLFQHLPNALPAKGLRGLSHPSGEKFISLLIKRPARGTLWPAARCDMGCLLSWVASCEVPLSLS